MSQDGYTLTEMLVALVLAGLAMAGASGAVRVLSQSQMRVVKVQAEASSLRLLDREIPAMLAHAGPFETSIPRSLVGTRSDAKFPCDGKICSITIRQSKPGVNIVLGQSSRTRTVSLPRRNAVTLNYISALDGRGTEEWPPRDRPDRLGAIALMDGATPLAVGDLVIGQPAACAFDARTGSCSDLGDAK